MQVQQLPDNKLVKLYLSGNEEALGELVNRHKDRIYTYIFMFVRDAPLAEDLLQETFIKVIDKLRTGKYQEQNKFLPWISRVAYNLCVDYYRREKRLPRVVTREGFDIFSILKFSDSSVEDRIIEDQTVARVRSLIEKLPEEQKEVLILRHYSDMSFKEISELTGVSINTALGRMRYALINLRKLMAAKNISI
jgi:RNA polymerase sigma-70 factor (ECF subfamily)